MTRGLRFSTLREAQIFASAAQFEHGDRNEDPTAGGLGRRLGSAARDPWPTTPREQTVRSGAGGYWVPLDDAVDAGPLDTSGTLDLPSLENNTGENIAAVLVKDGSLVVRAGQVLGDA